MVQTVATMMAAANAAVKRISYADAVAMIADNNALLLDVRDAPEVEKTGIATGAIHISRGMLELRADAATPFHDKEMSISRPVILYCASGGRAALAGKLLIDMGYTNVQNLGGLKDWQENGGAVTQVVDPGMG